MSSPPFINGDFQHSLAKCQTILRTPRLVRVISGRPDSNLHIQRRPDIQFPCIDCDLSRGSVLALAALSHTLGTSSTCRKNMLCIHSCTPTTPGSSTTAADLTTPTHCPSRYADDINDYSWCKSRRLQLNADKIEAILAGSRPTQTVQSKSTRPRFNRLLSSATSASILTANCPRSST